MWSVVYVCLSLQVFAVFGQNLTRFAQMENKAVVENSQANINDLTKELNEVKMPERSLLNEIMDWASSATEFIREKKRTQTLLNLREDGRKLKYKKAELKFVMKSFLLLKIILGLILPLGIIASKILSWKAVTLSLMAFMLAKILFIKNLLTGKNSFSITPTNFAPPLFVQGGQNDAFWKRQVDVQNVYPWAST